MPITADDLWGACYEAKWRDGKNMVVTEDGVVFNEREMWLTQKTYEKLKELTQ